MQYNFNHPEGGFAIKVYTVSGLYSRTVRAADMHTLATEARNAVDDGYVGVWLDMDGNLVYSL